MNDLLCLITESLELESPLAAVPQPPDYLLITDPLVAFEPVMVIRIEVIGAMVTVSHSRPYFYGGIQSGLEFHQNIFDLIIPDTMGLILSRIYSGICLYFDMMQRGYTRGLQQRSLDDLVALQKLYLERQWRVL